MISTIFLPGLRCVRATRFRGFALYAACVIVLGSIATAPTLADDPPRKKGFFGLDTGPGTSGPTPEQIAELNKRLQAVMKLVGEGEYAEADAALKQLKEDAAGIKSDGIDNLERIIKQRLTEQRPRSSTPPTPARPTEPIPGKTRPKQPAPKNPFATQKQLDRLLEMDDAAKQSVHEKPGELTDKQKIVADEITRLLRFGKIREATPLLRELRSIVQKRAAPRHAIVEGLMAEIANASKRYTMAMNLAGPFVDKRDEYHRAKFNCYLQVAYAHLGLEAPDPAAELFNWIALQENDGDALNQILAIEGVGRVHLYNEKLARAENAFGFALHNIKAMLAKHEYADYLSEDELAFIDLLRDRLRAQLDRVKHLRFLERVGPIFILYRDAQRLRLEKKDYFNAIHRYKAIIKEFPASSYADASKLYLAYCELEVGAWQASSDALSAFIEADKGGLYRGEAIMLRARIALEKHRDAGESLRHIEQGLAWLRLTRRGLNPRKLVDVLPSANEIIRPPLDRHEWPLVGEPKTSQITADTLLNRLTARWYLDWLEEEFLKLSIFTDIVLRTNEGQNHLSRLLKLNPKLAAHDRNGGTSYISRLRFGVERGYLVAYPEELERFPEKRRFYVVLADFYYVTGNVDRAFVEIERGLKGDWGELSRSELDYLYYLSALANQRMMRGDNKQISATIRLLEKVLETNDNTWTEYRAAYAIGTLSTQLRDKRARAKGRNALVALATLRRNNQYVYQARVALAMQAWAENDIASARKWLKRTTRDAGTHYENATQLLAHIEADLAEKE